MDAFTLVGWREAPATPSADDSCTNHAGAAGRTRPQQGSAFQGGNRLTAQHTGQLNPLRAANTRAPFDQLGRHFGNRRPSPLGLAVRHLPYCHPDLGTGSKTRLPEAGWNSHPLRDVLLTVERTFRTS